MEIQTVKRQLYENDFLFGIQIGIKKALQIFSKARCFL